ncbi:MAG: Mov34/MPN/PAD-1 family protein [Nanoarchaeota archaeon]|nr:Mov34/MPN/PAD-1 family protein [Nanoarchaeota archaeon]
MKLFNKLKKWSGKWLKKSFDLEKYEFDKIIIDKEVIDNIIELAKQTYPKEFIAFLEGKTENPKFSEYSQKANKSRKKVMRVYGLAYQEYYANEHSTLSKINFPITSNIVGSIHSHPGPSNRPSNADLHFFSKRGLVHLIIKTPYRTEDIQGYDVNGNPITFEVEG